MENATESTLPIPEHVLDRVRSLESTDLGSIILEPISKTKTTSFPVTAAHISSTGDAVYAIYQNEPQKEDTHAIVAELMCYKEGRLEVVANARAHSHCTKIAEGNVDTRFEKGSLLEIERGHATVRILRLDDLSTLACTRLKDYYAGGDSLNGGVFDESGEFLAIIYSAKTGSNSAPKSVLSVLSTTNLDVVCQYTLSHPSKDPNFFALKKKESYCKCESNHPYDQYLIVRSLDVTKNGKSEQCKQDNPGIISIFKLVKDKVGKYRLIKMDQIATRGVPYNLSVLQTHGMERSTLVATAIQDMEDPLSSQLQIHTFDGKSLSPVLCEDEHCIVRHMVWYPSGQSLLVGKSICPTASCIALFDVFQYTCNTEDMQSLRRCVQRGDDIKPDDKELRVMRKAYTRHFRPKHRKSCRLWKKMEESNSTDCIVDAHKGKCIALRVIDRPLCFPMQIVVAQFASCGQYLLLVGSEPNEIISNNLLLYGILSTQFFRGKDQEIRQGQSPIEYVRREDESL
jgi:hypothetical protein